MTTAAVAKFPNEKHELVDGQLADWKPRIQSVWFEGTAAAIEDLLTEGNIG